MPTFTFTSPEGKNYEVNGPDGATKEQAYQMLQKQIGLGKQNTAPKQAAPMMSDVEMQGAMLPKGANVLGGPEAAMNMATGLIAKPVSDIAGLAALGKEIVSPSPGGGDPAGFKRQVQNAMTYEPRTKAGKVIAEYNPLALLGKGVGKVADVAGDVVKGDGSSVARNAAGDAVREGVEQGAGFVLPKAARAAGKVAEAIPKNIKLTPEMTAINTAAKGIGVDLLPHQLSSNKYVKLAGSEAGKVPLSGSKEVANQLAWEKALAEKIGGDVKGGHLTSKVYDYAMRKSGATIDRIMGKYNVKIDPAFTADIDALKKGIANETPENIAKFNSVIDDLNAKITGGTKPPTSPLVNANGQPIASTSKVAQVPPTINGIALRKWNTALKDKIRKTSDGDLRHALSELQDKVIEHFNAGVTDKTDISALKTAREQYAIAKDIAPIVGNLKGVSPPALRARLRDTKFKKELYARGKSSLKDLADIGDLLKDPNTSMTAERAGLYGLAGGAGAVLTGVAPTVALPAAAATWAGANAYNRFGNRMLPSNIPPVPKPGARGPGLINYGAVPVLANDRDE